MCASPRSAGQSGGVNIEGKVDFVGGDIVGGNKITGILPDQLPAIIEAATSPSKRLTDEQRNAITKLKSKDSVSMEALQALVPDLSKADIPSAVSSDEEIPLWCPRIVQVVSGKFQMGSPNADAYYTEKPLHSVNIKCFVIGKYPVTFDEFDYYCETTRQKKPGDNNWGRGRRPVINVNWDDASAYLVWLTGEMGRPYRLPTEAEWEYACRAGTATSTSFGDSIEENSVNYNRRIGKTTEVGSYSPNLWEIYDMHGNVWEWTQDAWHECYNAAPSDGTAWTTTSDPQFRVVRGGSYASNARFVRCASRASLHRTFRLRNTGFRIAYSI